MNRRTFLAAAVALPVVAKLPVGSAAPALTTTAINFGSSCRVNISLYACRGNGDWELLRSVDTMAHGSFFVSNESQPIRVRLKWL